MNYIYILPFILLLLTIALCPVISMKFWENNYKKIILIFSSITIFSNIFIIHDISAVILSFIEYLEFIIFIVVLYVISGGINLKINKTGTPMVNTLILLCGAILANVIGTTGAAILLIKPYIKINKHRIKPYNIVFFIFIVCNIGGCLSPIGDPPLFSGFLKGVPFTWPLRYNLLPWIITNGMLLLIFYILDNKNELKVIKIQNYGSTIEINGKQNLIFVALTIFAIFLNPMVFNWVPTVNIYNHNISFLKDILLITIGITAYKLSNKEILKKNEFSFNPVIELAFMFFGIFITMGQALTIIEEASSNITKGLISPGLFFWVIAFLSSFLDNTPTYMNSLALMMSLEGANISNPTEVLAFSNGLYPNSILFLRIICVTSVYFGGFTYIGNGPNFIIKSIAEKEGIKMPSFFGYILKYSCIYLLPVLTLIWFIFF